MVPGSSGLGSGSHLPALMRPMVVHLDTVGRGVPGGLRKVAMGEVNTKRQRSEVKAFMGGWRLAEARAAYANFCLPGRRPSGDGWVCAHDPSLARFR